MKLDQVMGKLGKSAGTNETTDKLMNLCGHRKTSDTHTAVRKTACDKVNISCISAQNMLKRFRIKFLSFSTGND